VRNGRPTPRRGTCCNYLFILGGIKKIKENVGAKVKRDRLN